MCRANSLRHALGWALAATLCVSVAGGAFAGAALARTGSASVRLSKAPARTHIGALVTFGGRAGAEAGVRVVIERRLAGRWRVIVRGHTGARGRFALTWFAPLHRGSALVRAATVGAHSRTSASRRIRVRPLGKGVKLVRPSSHALVISPSVVASVPPPGQSGMLSYAGGNDAQVGQIVAIGQGSSTPNGFLGRVTKVTDQRTQTLVATTPATLEQAIPNGSIDLAASTVSATDASLAHAAASISCQGSADVSITHTVSFSAGLDLEGSWSLLHGLQSASLTANASVSASLQAIAQAAGSCSLPQTTLLSVNGPSVDAFVGPIPVVMTSKLSVYLNASASVQGAVSTGVTAGFSASAGIGWTPSGGFQPTQSFTPQFSFQPPTLSASASVTADVTPTIDVLLYGVVGPQIALKAGPAFNADISANPWWTLSVPIDLTASVSIPPLNLTSPTLDIYQHTFPVADAGGPFAPGGGTGPSGITNVATPASSIAAGYDQACGLRSSGAVGCWGANSSGQLGDGTTTNRSAPVAVSGITNAAAIVAGSSHTCALLVHGGVECWGANADGALGNGTTTASPTPVAVTGISDATAVASGSDHSCAIVSGGSVDCWGTNSEAQLGDGTTNNSPSPDRVSGITNARALAAGTFHTCALLSTGGVECWGNNVDGSLGNGSTATTRVPVAVSGISTATAVAAGADHSCALLSSGGVDCWGSNGDGQLGTGGGDSSVPVAVSGITNAVGLAAGGGHTCAVLSSGTVDCWGYNNYGQLGNGNTTNSPVPVAVSGITNASAVTGGLEQTCALLKTGGIDCWGYGGDGELGNGTTTMDSSTPVAVTGFP